MPGTTTFAAIKYALAADETKAFPAEVSEPGAKTIDKYLEEHTLTWKLYNGAATLKSGELAQQNKAGETFTLPAAATANQLIGVWAGAACKVTTSGGAFIDGDFLAAGKEATISLTAAQHVILQSNGTDWLIIAGEPKREQKYEEKTFTKAEIEAGVELSASRMAYLDQWSTSPTGQTVGGISVTFPYLVPPGQKVKGTTGAASVVATFLLL